MENIWISESKDTNNEWNTIWLHIIKKTSSDERIDGILLFSTENNLKKGKEIYSLNKNYCHPITKEEYVKYKLLGYLNAE